STNNLSASFNGTTTGAGSIVKAGTGTQTLTSGNTYTGGTTVNAGVLSADNAQSLGTGPVTLNAGNLRLGNALNPISSPVAFTGINQALVRAVPDPNSGTFGTTASVDTPTGFGLYERGVAGAPNANFGLPPSPNRTFTSLNSGNNVTYQ